MWLGCRQLSQPGIQLNSMAMVNVRVKSRISAQESSLDEDEDRRLDRLDYLDARDPNGTQVSSFPFPVLPTSHSPCFVYFLVLNFIKKLSVIHNLAHLGSCNLFLFLFSSCLFLPLFLFSPGGPSQWGRCQQWAASRPPLPGQARATIHAFELRWNFQV